MSFYKSIRLKKGVYVLIRAKYGSIYRPSGGLWVGSWIGVVRRQRHFRCRFNPRAQSSLRKVQSIFG